MSAKRPSALPEYRLPFIEGIRGIAALYVVLGHFCSMADPRAFQAQISFAPLWLQRVMAPFWQGHLAVAAFIVLSGFCLQMSLFPGKDGRVRKLGEYLKRRARRMLPAYYACLAVSLAVCATITVKQTGMPFEQYLPVTQQNVVAHLLLYHNWSSAWMYKINGVLWSIAIEAQLYLLFPILVVLAFKAGRFALACLVALGSVAVLTYVPNSVKLYPWYVALFAMGLIAAHLAYRPSLKHGVAPRLARLLALASAIACGLCISLGQPIYASDAFASFTVAAVLYSGLITPQHWLMRVLGWKPLAGLGLFSYSLYLMHHPIQQILFSVRPAWATGEQGVFTYLLATLPLILLGAWCFWFLFERPFLKRPNLYQSDHTLAPTHVPVGIRIPKEAFQNTPAARRGGVPVEELFQPEDVELPEPALGRE